jgi:hypothetical protein
MTTHCKQSAITFDLAFCLLSQLKWCCGMLRVGLCFCLSLKFWKVWAVVWGSALNRLLFEASVSWSVGFLPWICSLCHSRWLFEASVRSSVNKIRFYLSQNDWKRKDYTKCYLTHVRSSLFASKQGRGSGQKKLAFANLPQHPRDFWYLKYPGDQPRVAGSL